MHCLKLNYSFGEKKVLAILVFSRDYEIYVYRILIALFLMFLTTVGGFHYSGLLHVCRAIYSVYF